LTPGNTATRSRLIAHETAKLLKSDFPEAERNFLLYREGVIQEKREKRERLHSAQVQHNRRRARVKGAVGSFTREEWRDLKLAHGGCCAYCGMKTKKLSVDHVVPLSKGGTNYISNIKPACRSCNSRKGNRDPEIFSGSAEASGC